MARSLLTVVGDVPFRLGVERAHYAGAVENLRPPHDATGEKSCRDWGLEWNTPMDSGGLMISDRIFLKFEISAVRRGAQGGGEHG